MECRNRGSIRCGYLYHDPTMGCHIARMAADRDDAVNGLVETGFGNRGTWSRWKGRHILITGSGTGIGHATARAMAANGAKVMAHTTTGEQTAHIASEAGGHCISVTADVSQEDSVRTAIEKAVQHCGGLHILHNNAGELPNRQYGGRAPIEEFSRTVRLDPFGTFLRRQSGISAIIASGGGR